MGTKLSLAGKAGVLLLLTLVVAAAWFSRLDTTATGLVETGMKRAFVTFASARALNAAISMAQGTEINAAPGGVGLTLSVGQALDPVNDLVEQFSNFMLAATVALGIEKVLLAMGQYGLVKILLTMLAATWGLLLMLGKTPPRLLQQILLLMLMVRFAVPLVTVGTEAVFQRFLARDYQTSQIAVEASTSQVSRSDGQTIQPSQNAGMFGRFSNWVSNLSAQVNPVPALEKLKQSAEQAAEHVVKLIVVFLLQTLIIPLAMIWVLYLGARSLLTLPWQKARTESPS